jgi:HprK-related kinase A
MLQNGLFGLKIGPFVIRIQSPVQAVQEGVQLLYSDYPVQQGDFFADYHVRLFTPSGPRRYWRKQVLFAADQFQPFKPLPYAQALPFFEWGLNWCISAYAHHYLIIHAAVVGKKGLTLVLPGEPGAGKSTLCAALVNSGWRLLSDELTLIDRQTGLIFPVPRPVSLKNDSIDIIKQAFPASVFSPTVHDTLKGSVALMKPPAESVQQMAVAARPALVVFPRYQKQADLTLSPVSKGEGFMRLAGLSFNYPVLGAEGFRVLTRYSEQCTFFDFDYDGDFAKAIQCFEQLVTEVE